MLNIELDLLMDLHLDLDLDLDLDLGPDLPHFDHWKLRYELLKVYGVGGWVGGWVATLIIVSLQVLPFEFLTLNVEY